MFLTIQTQVTNISLSQFNKIFQLFDSLSIDKYIYQITKTIEQMNSFRRMVYLQEDKQAPKKDMVPFQRSTSFHLINRISQANIDSQISIISQKSSQAVKFKSFNNSKSNKSVQFNLRECQKSTEKDKGQKLLNKLMNYDVKPLSKKKLTKVHLKRQKQAASHIEDTKQQQNNSPTLDVFKAIVFYNDQLQKIEENTNKQEKMKKTLKFIKKQEGMNLTAEMVANSNQLQQIRQLSQQKLKIFNYQTCSYCGQCKESFLKMKIKRFCQEMQNIFISLKDMNKKLNTQFKNFRKQCQLKIMLMLQRMPDSDEFQINKILTLEKQNLKQSQIQHSLSQGSDVIFMKTASQACNQADEKKNSLTQQKKTRKQSQEINKNNNLFKQNQNQIGHERSKTQQFFESFGKRDKNFIQQSFPSPSQSVNTSIINQIFKSEDSPKLIVGKIIKNKKSSNQSTVSKKKPFSRVIVPKIQLPIFNGVLAGFEIDDPIYTEQNCKTSKQMTSSKNPRSPPTRQMISTERIGKIFRNLPINQNFKNKPGLQFSAISHRGTRSLNGSLLSADSKDDYKSCYANIKSALDKIKQII